MSMKIGIRAWIDFAFRKIFGKPENEICIVSLLNAGPKQNVYRRFGFHGDAIAKASSRPDGLA